MATDYYLGELCKPLVAKMKQQKFNIPKKDPTMRDYYTVKKIIDNLVQTLKREGLTKNANAIVFRWLLSQKLFDIESANDPIIPTSTSINQGFRVYLKSKGFNAGSIDSLEKEFANIITTSKNQLDSYEEKEYGNPILVQLEHYLTITTDSLSFNITMERFAKLKKSYLNFSKSEDGLMLYLFKLLMRYNPITELCSGYSGGCPPRLFSCLQEKLKVDWELFASPLNNTLDNYFSAYDDTDIPFGSKGNFFSKFNDLVDLGGNFELNPPFTEEYLSITTEMILEALIKHKDDDIPLTFVYIHPTWDDLYGYKNMKNSEFLIKELCFSQKKHYYYSGLQHDPYNNRVSASSAASTIFLLQNNSAKIVNPITPDIIRAIKESFSTNS